MGQPYLSLRYISTRYPAFAGRRNPDTQIHSPLCLEGTAMTSATCSAEPPSSLQIVNGRRVYRSVHLAGVINDSGSDIVYNIDVAMSDSQGHIQTQSLPGQVAPGSGSQSSSVGPLFLDLDANLYNSGDEIVFTCETRVTGGVSASDTKSNRLTIP